MTSFTTVPILCPVLIGRTAQLEALTRLIEQARRGAGQTALIAGEAGIGKSRLVAELKSRAAQLGFSLLQGNCFDSDRVPALRPAARLAAQLLCHTDAEIAASLGTRSRTHKTPARTCPVLPEFPPAPALEPAEKRRLVTALAHLYRRSRKRASPAAHRDRGFALERCYQS